MKAIRLLIAAMLITTSVSARSYEKELRLSEKDPEEVLFIVNTMGSDPEICEFESPEKLKIHLREQALCTKRTRDMAAAQVTAAHKSGFQSAQAPSFIFAQKENKFSFGIGGFIQLRTSYDFNGTVSNIDFVTADIPIPGGYASHQQVMMDASTSRIFFTGVVNSRALGAVEIFVDMDFRGDVGYGDEGITNSYTPRLRCAYASFLGVTIGRDITTFCDLNSAPETIDFQGPNAYSFNYATLIRYERTFCNNRLQAGIALEMPNVSGTYGSSSTIFKPIVQRVPDIPMYIQCRLGRDMEHHIRVSGVFRDMYYFDSSTGKNTDLLGWGVQASGRLQPAEWFGLCFNGTYGQGITNYIQDLNGLGLDFTPNPANASELQTMPMYAWQAALNFNLTCRLTANGGYSSVNVEKKNGYYSDTEYKHGQYIFANLFYDVTPRLQIACEYLYGKRENMNGDNNFANRANIMAQFNF